MPESVEKLGSYCGVSMSVLEPRACGDLEEKTGVRIGFGFAGAARLTQTRLRVPVYDGNLERRMAGIPYKQHRFPPDVIRHAAWRSSCRAASGALGCGHCHRPGPVLGNNRAENAHPPVRPRERNRQRFTSQDSAQKFRAARGRKLPGRGRCGIGGCNGDGRIHWPHLRPFCLHPVEPVTPWQNPLSVSSECI